jgi:hypothetical protein
MTVELRSLLIWIAAFLAFELPANFNWVPWYTLSKTVQLGETWWAPVGIFVIVIMAVLLGHFELHWSVKWLILVSVIAALLIASHTLEAK